MGHYKPRRTALRATVSLSALTFISMTLQEAAAGEVIDYTGTQAEYNALDPVGVIKPTGSDNTVTVSDPNSTGSNFNDLYYVYGGTGSSSGSITISNNSVDISGGTIRSSVYGADGDGYAGGYSLSVTDNSVYISGGTISDGVFGGSGEGYAGSSLSITDNSVYISGGTIGSGYRSSIFGGAGGGSGSIRVSNNSIHISSGTIYSSLDPDSGIFGGFGSGSGSDSIAIF